jgi:hypothetical protein
MKTTIIRILSRILCALRGHRFGPSKLALVSYGEIVKDAAQACCRDCGAVHIQIIPFKRFHFQRP